MSIVNPIKYTIYEGQSVPGTSPKLPIVEVASDEEAYGSIDVKLGLTVATTLTAQVYLLAAPTSADDRWIRRGTDLLPTHPTLVSFSGAFSSDMVTYTITWRFDPTVISSILSDGDFYSVEFFVNATNNAGTKQASPKVIVKISDLIF